MKLFNSCKYSYPCLRPSCPMPNPIDHDRLTAAILASPTYRLAQQDHEFLDSEAARGARLQLELMRPERYLEALKVDSTVVVVGSARLLPPDEAQRQLDALIADGSNSDPARMLSAKLKLKYAKYYAEAREFSRRVSETCQCDGQRRLVIVTG